MRPAGQLWARRGAKRYAGLTLGTLLMASAACSVVLNHSAAQCASDSDCAKFGDHPYCQGGVCVSSGLGPAGCFYGTPQNATDFLNQCSTAVCTPFENCAHVGLCDAGVADAPLTPPPPPPEAGTTSTGMDGGEAGAPALPNCLDSTQGRGQILVMTGSSNFPPLLAKLAPLVISAGYTPVFQVSNSCTGVNSIFSANPSQRSIVDPQPGPGAKYATYFQNDGSSVACTLGPGGMSVDVGESDIYSTTCAGIGPHGASIGEYLGPIQAMVFVTPAQSDQQAITADAARAVFGMGGKAAPWTNPSLFYVRNGGTGTQQMIGHAINVPANQFWGIDRGSASAVDQDLKIITDPRQAQQAIGIISADYYDQDRSNLKALAFQAEAQDCAYLPDSTAFKKDKRNIRDGHYPIWGPIHFFTAVSGGIPVSAAAQAFVSIVAVADIPQSLLDAFIGASLVPSCAMAVQRSSELGPLSTYAPPFECSCYFEASPNVNGSAPAGCSRCNTSNDCTDPRRPSCNLGYCEVQ